VAAGASFVGTFEREEAVQDESSDYFAAGHPLVEGATASAASACWPSTGAAWASKRSPSTPTAAAGRSGRSDSRDVRCAACAWRHRAGRLLPAGTSGSDTSRARSPRAQRRSPWPPSACAEPAARDLLSWRERGAASFPPRPERAGRPRDTTGDHRWPTPSPSRSCGRPPR
jgi:hypothetical protein